MSSLIEVPHPRLKITLHRCTEADTEAISNWCDVFMAGDYFVRKGHMLNLVKNPVIRVCAVIIDEMIAGFVAVYKDTTLQNLLIDPQYRGQGIGSALISVLKPSVIRCKKNMLAGDPQGFYEQNGFAVVAPDPARPHIVTMTNDPAKVPLLADAASKKVKNQQRMKELRELQAKKRAEAQANALEQILKARGIIPPDGKTPHGWDAPGRDQAHQEAPPATPSVVESLVPANPPPPPPPPAAPSPETFVNAGHDPLGLWN